MPKALFITGNKRSGTSQLVRLLNLHPEIFVSHESDAVLIISRFLKGEPFLSHAADSSVGMEYTLKICGQLLSKQKSAAENFFAIQKKLMETGSPWLPSEPKKDPQWVGDKKPFQYSDPSITDFIRSSFPQAVFIHLVRHPFAVAQSAQKFNKTVNGDFWRGLSLEEMVEEWAKNENNVLELKKSGWAKVMDVRYEDLCKETDKELTRIFNFLGLKVNANILKTAAKTTRYTLKKIPIIPCSQNTLSIMGQYGYTPGQAEKGRAQILLSNLYWKVHKKIYA